MQPEYLARLSRPVQQFILEVEEGAGLDISVVLDPRQNDAGPGGLGHLAVTIEAGRIQLFAPTNGYFPDGAVRHEVLHAHRFLIEGVPKLALSDRVPWDKHFSDVLGSIDNALEHVVIVPVELNFHPERREHWEAVMRTVCSDLPNIPEGERRLAIGLHWTFLRHVLPDSPFVDIARSFAKKHALLEMADQFADRFLSLSTCKEELVRLLFLTFPEIPEHRASLEYLNSAKGRFQTPIP